MVIHIILGGASIRETHPGRIPSWNCQTSMLVFIRWAQWQGCTLVCSCKNLHCGTCVRGTLLIFRVANPIALRSYLRDTVFTQTAKASSQACRDRPSIGNCIDDASTREIYDLGSSSREVTPLPMAEKCGFSNTKSPSSR